MTGATARRPEVKHGERRDPRRRLADAAGRVNGTSRTLTDAKEGSVMSERVKVANLSELPPGTGRQVKAGGRALAVFNVDGTIHVIDGTCTHRGGPLGEGELNGTVVSCPWHGGKFDVTT